MQDFPHHYTVSAGATAQGDIDATSTGLPDIAVAAPAEFSGPGDRWSPETLLVASVVSCFLLTFRAIAQNVGLEWHQLDCSGVGTLDRVDRQMRFTGIALTARLGIPAGGDARQAQELLKRSESKCLITASLGCPVTLQAEVNGAGSS